MVIHASLPDVEIPNTTLDQYLFSLMEQHGDKISLIDADCEEKTLTFRQVKENSVKCANALLHLGVRKGDRVAVCVSNCTEYAYILLGTSAIGAILTTCNPNYIEDEICHQFKNYQPAIVIAEANNYKIVKNAAKNFLCIKDIFTVNECSDCESFHNVMEKFKRKDQTDSKSTTENVKFSVVLSLCNNKNNNKQLSLSLCNNKKNFFMSNDINLEEIFETKMKEIFLDFLYKTPKLSFCLNETDEGSTIVPSQKVYPEDTCILLSSSGTTGLPKGVKLSHRNFIAVIQLARNSFDVRSFDILYMILPMFHSFGAAVMSLGLAQGITLIVRRRYSIETFFHDVEKYKITCMQAVPPIVLDIHNSSLNTRYDTSSLKKIMTAAAPLPHGVAELVKKKLGISVYQGWGTTEALPLTVSTPNTLIPIESVGCVVSNTKIKVVDPVTGKELLPNQSGEILAKGPQVMAGYYKNPTATAETIDKNGWYHTGDIGYYDKYGLLYVVDRLKEMIKYKGFQVAPAELEEVLLRHPGISDAAVIGIPDQKAGEVPKAYVVKKNQQLTSNEIHEFLKDKVSSFKHLRGGIVFRDSIPKSASGKILRRELRVLERNSKL